MDSLKEKGINVFSCYQCLKCSTGCPLSEYMDFYPHQVMKKLQMGEEERLLASRTVWLCASCITCSVRCPRGIDIAEVMDSLRRESGKSRLFSPQNLPFPSLNNIFVRNIEKYGRIHEISLIMGRNIRLRQLFRDFQLAPFMVFRKRIPLFPPRVKGKKRLREIFKKMKEEISWES